MNNNLLQIKIKQRLNKLASYDYDNLECWQIQEAINKAQLSWVRRQVNGLNLKKEGSEQSTGLIDDLQVLLRHKELSPLNRDSFYEAPLPADYLYYVRVHAMAKTDCCPPRRLTVYEAEEANVSVLLNSHTMKPDFEWAETFSTLMDNNLRIYTDGKFNLSLCELIYFRHPREVRFLNCVNPRTGVAYTEEQTLEFKDDVADIMIDEAAAIISGDIESINQYQRHSQEVQKNS